MPKVIPHAKDHLLQMALSIVLEEGLTNLTIRHLAERSLVSIGTIYNYFPDKKTLDYELLGSVWRTFLKDLDQQKAEPLDVQLRLIYARLSQIISMFTGVVTEFYQQGGGAHRNEMFKELTVKITEILKQSHQTCVVGIDRLAEWITMNLIMMCHMRTLDYSVFETLLKKLMED